MGSLMVYRDFIEVLSSLPLESSSTVACISASTTLSSPSSLVRMLESLFPPPWMGSNRHGWAHVLPHRHRPKTHDDDIWWWSQVQWIIGLLQTGPQERGIHVLDEGSRS